MRMEPEKLSQFQSTFEDMINRLVKGGRGGGRGSDEGGKESEDGGDEGGKGEEEEEKMEDDKHVHEKMEGVDPVRSDGEEGGGGGGRGEEKSARTDSESSDESTESDSSSDSPSANQEDDKGHMTEAIQLANQITELETYDPPYPELAQTAAARLYEELLWMRERLQTARLMQEVRGSGRRERGRWRERGREMDGFWVGQSVSGNRERERERRVYVPTGVHEPPEGPFRSLMRSWYQ